MRSHRSRQLSVQLKNPPRAAQARGFEPRVTTTRPACSRVVRRRDGRETPCCGFGAWVVCVDVRSKEGSKPHGVKTPLVVCHRHRSLVVLADVVTERTWSSMCAQLRVTGVAMPKRSLTKLSFARS